MSVDALIDKIREKKNPTVAGLDPQLAFIPQELVDKYIRREGDTLGAAAQAVLEYNRALIDTLCDIVPAVKLQAACYEMFGPEGLYAMQQTIDYAKARGLYAMADAKRGDIGSTAQAYSAAWLGGVRVGGKTLRPFGADCLTVNGYLGTDGIKPFVDVCREEKKMIFALIKTSNPSSGELQDLLAGNREIYRVMGDLVRQWGEGTQGRYGYNAVGGVVGATYPEQLKSLREQLPDVFFLVPGYGAQGGGAQDVRHAFDRRGLGAIVNSSRAILCAWQKTGKGGEDFAGAARAEAIRMRDDIARFVTIE